MSNGVDLNDDESLGTLAVRAIALHAAASSWSGISSIKARDTSILETADTFVNWLLLKGQEDA